MSERCGRTVIVERHRRPPRIQLLGREAFARQAVGVVAELSAAAGDMDVADLDVVSRPPAMLGGPGRARALERAHKAAVRAGDPGLGEAERSTPSISWTGLRPAWRRGTGRRLVRQCMRVLDEDDLDRVERGSLRPPGLVGASTRVMVGGLEFFTQAATIAARFDDADLGRTAASAAARASRRWTADGVALLDEAMIAGHTSGEALPIAMGIVYCAAISWPARRRLRAAAGAGMDGRPEPPATAAGRRAVSRPRGLGSAPS